MKVLSWNCRGLGQALTVRTARNLAQQHRVNLVFFMERKCCVEKLKGLGFCMGFKHSVGIDAMGLAGGIWAAWDDCYQVVSVHLHPRFLLLKVTDERGV